MPDTASTRLFPDFMMLLRLVMLLVIVAVLMWLLKRLFSTEPEPERLESSHNETMRQCRYCGVHVPESSSVRVEDKTYCCSEHAELDQ